MSGRLCENLDDFAPATIVLHCGYGVSLAGQSYTPDMVLSSLHLSEQFGGVGGVVDGDAKRHLEPVLEAREALKRALLGDDVDVRRPLVLWQHARDVVMGKESCGAEGLIRMTECIDTDGTSDKG